MDGITISPSTCIVCGDTVWADIDYEGFAMCSTHSKDDQNKTLDRLMARIELSRAEINGKPK